MKGTVRSRVEALAAETPDAVFLISPETGADLTYGNLNTRLREIEHQLAAMGLKPGNKVAFLLDNGSWSASLFLGVMYAGMIVVPLNAVAGVAQVSAVLEHCDANVLFVSDKYVALFADAISACSRELTLVDTNEDTGPTWPSASATPSELVAPAIDAQDDALLLYTSGTTGMPKGARMSHRAVLAGGHNTALAHELTANDRALCVLPLYHINAEMVTVMGPLVSGGSVVLPRRFSASDFWQLVVDHRCTWVSIVPTIASYLLDRAPREPWTFGESPELKQLRFARSASAPLPAAVQQAFEQTFAIPTIETMGMTETAAPLLSNPMPPQMRKSGSPGIEFGNEVCVADEAGKPVADGTVGEILIRGDNVLTSYYKNPEASASAFHADNWFRSGDLGFRDDEGYYFITGRLKELIIKGGENIAPREIDEVLGQHEAVLEAAAVGVPHDTYGQDVVACVLLREGQSASEGELRAHCEKLLGKFKTPTTIHFMTEMPRGPSGKIQRLKLPEIIGAV